MDISIYFEAVDLSDFQNSFAGDNPRKMGNAAHIYSTGTTFPDLEGAIDIALIGVKEDRLAQDNKGCAEAPDQIRQHFYRLFHGNYNVRIADLGNIKPGFTVEDTFFALRDVVVALLQSNIIPVIIGGSQDLTFANYLAYESIGKIINIVSVDNSFDIGKNKEAFNSAAFLNRIITHQPNILFNYTNIGHQTYMVDFEAIELMKNLYFDIYRLGMVQADTEEVEPMVRNADMISVDISSVRQSDAPGNGNASPNGFYGEELCRIMRYAGMSDKMTSLGIYEVNPHFDRNHQTSALAAQLIWHFIDGYYNRKHDFPIKEKKEYVKYRVAIKELNDEIVFYKSKKSDRWWVEVPCPTRLLTKYERHYLMPCSYNDYKTACNEDVPDRWWQAYQKLM
jgi:arginase family enzyme